MNAHQPIHPTIVISILGTQTMNPSIGHVTVPISIIQPNQNLLHQLHQAKPICYLLQHTQRGIMSYPLLCL
jgi:hypothetical protein